LVHAEERRSSAVVGATADEGTTTADEDLKAGQARTCVAPGGRGFASEGRIRHLSGIGREIPTRGMRPYYNKAERA
jgi:hypothetical protein